MTILSLLLNEYKIKYFLPAKKYNKYNRVLIGYFNPFIEFMYMVAPFIRGAKCPKQESVLK